MENAKRKTTIVFNKRNIPLCQKSYNMGPMDPWANGPMGPWATWTPWAPYRALYGALMRPYMGHFWALYGAL